MNYYVLMLLCLLSSTIGAEELDIAPDDCVSPDQCIQKLVSVIDRNATPARSPSTQEQAIINKLVLFGEQALPAVITLLGSEDELLARNAALTLVEFNSIDKKYLPAIADGIKRGVAWLAPALARIGTPEAAELAVRTYLTEESSPHNQEAYAIKLLDERALPALVQAAQCVFRCDDKTYYLIGLAIKQMDPTRTQVLAAQQFVIIATQKSLNKRMRQGALLVISYLGQSGKSVEKDLVTLRETAPQLRAAIDHALIGIKSDYAVSIYATMLASGVDRLLLRDIAALGVTAQALGVEIMPLLNSTERETRLLAARTLGFIGYTPAAPQLIKLMNEPMDVFLTRVSAESLGRLKTKEALPALQRVMTTHWYPPVRQIAQVAIEKINTNADYESKYHKDNFPSEYFSYDYFEYKSCDNVELKQLKEPEITKLYSDYAKVKLEKLSYQTDIVGYGAADEQEQRAADPNGIIRVNANNIIERRSSIKQIPSVALRAESGWLVGSSRGEWGGELVFVADNNTSFVVLNENVEDIYYLGDHIVAVTGVSHLGSNNGLLYRLQRNEKGIWQAKPWRQLPAAPYSSWLVEKGELLINTYSSGSIVVSKDGEMSMAKCAASAPDKTMK